MKIELTDFFVKAVALALEVSWCGVGLGEVSWCGERLAGVG